MKKLGHHGYSMVEMAVTVAILGILTSIAVPSFISIMPRVRLTNQASTLANEIVSQRMQAIARSTDFRISFDPANDRYTLERWSGSAFVAYATSTMSGTDLVSVLGEDTSAPGDDDKLVLFGTGGAHVPLGTKAAILLQVPGGELQKRILVEPSGRAVIEKRMGGGDWAAE